MAVDGQFEDKFADLSITTSPFATIFCLLQAAKT